VATITYRQLDANGDPIWGQGQANFLSDLAAVAQAIGTRLKLLQGEWWENLNTGTPIFQSMLGVGGSGKRPNAIALLITQRILTTPYVEGVSNVATSYNPATRAFQFSCQVETQFGTITVTNQPPASQTAPLKQSAMGTAAALVSNWNAAVWDDFRWG
jgi:hypothetical protein